MIRTSKKDIENEIKAGRFIEIKTSKCARYCVYNCVKIAYSWQNHRCTGLVFTDHNNIYATTSREIIEQWF